MDHSQPPSSPRSGLRRQHPSMFFRILVYLVIYDSGQVSLEHVLLSWYPSQSVKLGTPMFGNVTALRAGLLGPLAETPLIAVGAWHYTSHALCQPLLRAFLGWVRSPPFVGRGKVREPYAVLWNIKGG